MKTTKATDSIWKVLDLSMKHISRETNDWLCDASEAEGGETEWWYQLADSGWWVSCATVIEDVDDFVMPEDLKACIELGRTLGCAYLHFDRDAPVIEGLATYEW